LHEKGCVRIDDRSGKGHLLRVFLPEEIDGVVPKRSEVPVADMNEMDFYTNRTYVDALVKRENGRCFYCLRSINAETCVLDHVISKIARGDNSFRNVVACCHECNAAKQGQDATEFLRTRYRLNLLSQAELQERLSTLGKLQEGQLSSEI
jgi:HNH endonuclease